MAWSMASWPKQAQELKDFSKRILHSPFIPFINLKEPAKTNQGWMILEPKGTSSIHPTMFHYTWRPYPSNHLPCESRGAFFFGKHLQSSNKTKKDLVKRTADRPGRVPWMWNLIAIKFQLEWLIELQFRHWKLMVGRLRLHSFWEGLFSGTKLLVLRSVGCSQLQVTDLMYRILMMETGNPACAPTSSWNCHQKVTVLKSRLSRRPLFSLIPL